MQKVDLMLISCCVVVESCITMTLRLAGLDSKGLARV
jgi:hypothetical protein